MKIKYFNGWERIWILFIGIYFIVSIYILINSTKYITDKINNEHNLQVHFITYDAAKYIVKLYENGNKETIKILNESMIPNNLLSGLPSGLSDDDSVNQNYMLTDEQEILNFNNLLFTDKAIYIERKIYLAKLEEIAEKTKDIQIGTYLKKYKFENDKDLDIYIKTAYLLLLLLLVVCLFIFLSVTTYIFPLFIYKVYSWIRVGFLTQ